MYKYLHNKIFKLLIIKYFVYIYGTYKLELVYIYIYYIYIPIYNMYIDFNRISGGISESPVFRKAEFALPLYLYTETAARLREVFYRSRAN